MLFQDVPIRNPAKNTLLVLERGRERKSGHRYPVAPTSRIVPVNAADPLICGDVAKSEVSDTPQPKHSPVTYLDLQTLSWDSRGIGERRYTRE